MGTGVGVGVGTGVGSGVGFGVGTGVGFGVAFGVEGVGVCADCSAFLSHAAKRSATDAQEMMVRRIICLDARRKFRTAQGSPRLLGRHIHDSRLCRTRWRKDGEKNQSLGKRIKGSMHLAHRDERHLAGADDAMLFAHPLLRAPGNNVD